MPDNSLAPPNMPWLWQPNSQPGQPNGLGPPMLNYAAPPNPAAPTVGQGVAQTAADVAQALPSWPSVEEQRRMLQPLPGWQGTAVDAAKQWAEGVMMGTTAPGDVPPPGIVAYHGSPHSFDQFDTSKIGTGEGAQAYGHGLYFAGNEEVAQGYRDSLSRDQAGYSFQGSRIDPAGGWTPQSSVAGWFEPPKAGESMGDMMARRAEELQQHGDFMAGSKDPMNQQSASTYYNAADKLRAQDPQDWNYNKGSMYEVNIGADPEHFLDWDKPLSEQSQQIQDLFAQHGIAHPENQPYIKGSDVHDFLSKGEQDPAAAAQRLKDLGIPGIRYLDQGSRGAGQGTHNYVVFDANTLSILKKYGIAGLIGGGAKAAASQQPESAQ
jgi:hypothetical protein